MRILLLFATIFIINVQTKRNYAINDFKAGFGTQPKPDIYDLDIFEPDVEQQGRQVLAVGDFDHDGSNDFLIVNDAHTLLSIYHYDETKGKYSFCWNMTIKDKIKGVIAGDFNFDGTMDFLAISETTDPTKVKMTLYEQEIKKGEVIYFKVAKNGVFETPYQQPMVLDIKGTRHLSILYFDENGVRLVKEYIIKQSKFKTEKFEKYVSKDKSCLQSNWKAKKIKVPNNNAFVDFNGDCKADLFIETVDANKKIWYEFWVKHKDTGLFCLVQHEKTNEKHHSALFVDLNNDGSMDFIILDYNLDLHVFYNKAKKQTTGTGILCSKYSQKAHFDPMDTKKTTNYYYKESLLKDNYFNTTNITAHDASIDQPCIMRYGDLNLDGYMDLLITVNIGNNTYGTSYLFQNTQCGYVTCEQFNVHNSTQIQKLYTNKTLYAFYYDVGEIGLMSFVQVVKQNNTSVIKTYINFMNQLNFFLKGKGYNGNFKHNGTIYGAIYYGITYQAEVSKRNGAKVVAYQTVLSRSGYSALDQTFVYFGLGQTNNYVQYFYVTMPLNTQYQRFWNLIIPNSLVEMYPANLTKDWTLEYSYQKLQRQTRLLLLANLAFLIILGVPICLFWKEERREDKNIAQDQMEDFLEFEFQ